MAEQNPFMPRNYCRDWFSGNNAKSPRLLKEEDYNALMSKGDFLASGRDMTAEGGQSFGRLADGSYVYCERDPQKSAAVNEYLDRMAEAAMSRGGNA